MPLCIMKLYLEHMQAYHDVHKAESFVVWKYEFDLDP